jgi:beta-lactamase class D
MVSTALARAVAACALVVSAAQAHADVVVRDDLKRLFDEAGTTGTFVLMDLSADRTTLVDPARAAQRFRPASTFKIPNSLIAFDTGAVRDDQEVLPYGGKPQPLKQWEHDMPLPEAIRLSAVPIYQEVARRIGPARMQAYVDAFDYGNRQIGSEIDQFWLRGPLEISALEEARFTSRMALQQLPVQPRTWEMVRRMLRLDPEPQDGDAVIYGKTGHRSQASGRLVGGLGGARGARLRVRAEHRHADHGRCQQAHPAGQGVDARARRAARAVRHRSDPLSGKP